MPQIIEVPGHGQVEFPDGMSDAQIAAAIKQNMPQEKPTATMDAVKSFGSGLVKGAIGLVGTVGDLNSLARSGADWIASKVLDQETYNRGREAISKSDSGLAPTSAQIRGRVEGVAGPLYEPQTRVGRYAGSVGEMTPAVLLGPGGLTRKGLQAAGAGIGSEAAGQATEGTRLEPYARVAGAFAGGYAPDIARRLITPNPVSPERARLLETLRDEGVTSLTAGQTTGNKAIQYAESILGDAPGAAQSATRVQQEGQRQFTEAAMRRAGAGPNAMPEVLADNSARLGREFKDLSARNTLAFDGQFIQDMSNATRNYSRVPDSQQRAIVQNYVTDIANHARSTGTMPGVEYQEMRSRLSRQANGLRNSDPTLSEALRDIRNALDNNMRRSISPADREAWDTARRQYSAQKILERAASRAGEATAEGQIVPANLRNAVTQQNHGAYARGQGDFAELARAGSGVMAPLPNSGTGQRVAINTIATLLGGGAGTLASGGAGGMAGILAGAAAPAVAGRVIMSPPTQRYLANQLIGAPTDEIRRATTIQRLAQTLLAARNQVPALNQ